MTSVKNKTKGKLTTSFPMDKKNPNKYDTQQQTITPELQNPAFGHAH